MRLILLAPLFAAGPAAAEWVYRAPAASDDLGSACVDNAQGQRLDVSCGNGGMVAVSLRPDLRVRMQPGDVLARIAFPVDGQTPVIMPAECAEWGCSSAGGWTAAWMRALTTALRGGSAVTVTLGPSTLASFGLAGSSAALHRLAATPRCEGF